jgi:hypothetical protein
MGLQFLLRLGSSDTLPKPGHSACQDRHNQPRMLLSRGTRALGSDPGSALILPLWCLLDFPVPIFLLACVPEGSGLTGFLQTSRCKLLEDHTSPCGRCQRMFVFGDKREKKEGETNEQEPCLSCLLPVPGLGPRLVPSKH